MFGPAFPAPIHGLRPSPEESEVQVTSENPANADVRRQSDHPQRISGWDRAPPLTPLPRSVSIGRTVGGFIVVQGGLVAGDTVVTDGQLRLSPGAKVRVKS